MFQIRQLHKGWDRGESNPSFFKLSNSHDIGSSSLSNICIADASLYAKHGKLFVKSNKWIIEADEAPFIEVNKVPVRHAELKPGDLIQLGDGIWQFELEPPIRKNTVIKDNLWILWAAVALVIQVVMILFLEQKM